ncbi:MAG: hypothetical protein CMG08_06415 [Candidatus Marinimicrobia bacterium]|nr:hypothetical protein [Candidatus Neomarinimicrobiota bacterium]
MTKIFYYLNYYHIKNKIKDIQMFCRINTIKHNGETDKIINNLRDQKDWYDKIEGLHSVTYVKLSNKEFMGCIIYDSKEHLEAANNTVKEFMKTNIMPFIESPPIIVEGEVPWRYSRRL